MSMPRLRALFGPATAMALLLSLTANAWGRAACAKRDEAIALETAAMQQKLMVAALSCRQAGLYNRFVLHYRDELRHSDAVLRHYFGVRGGMRGYHAYKTRLANSASLQSLHNIKHYCATAQAVFQTALDNPAGTLSETLDLDGNIPLACRNEPKMAERSTPR